MKFSFLNINVNYVITILCGPVIAVHSKYLIIYITIYFMVHIPFHFQL